jgi:hypothetical protein
LDDHNQRGSWEPLQSKEKQVPLIWKGFMDGPEEGFVAGTGEPLRR